MPATPEAPGIFTDYTATARMARAKCCSLVCASGAVHTKVRSIKATQAAGVVVQHDSKTEQAVQAAGKVYSSPWQWCRACSGKKQLKMVFFC